MSEINLTISEISSLKNTTNQTLPLFLARLSAGLPSPGDDDYIDEEIDLNQLLIKHPEATFFVKVEGNSMVSTGIHDGDILIVDRALEANSRDIIVAAVNGELTVKRIKTEKETDFYIWGVVTYVIHRL